MGEGTTHQTRTRAGRYWAVAALIASGLFVASASAAAADDGGVDSSAPAGDLSLEPNGATFVAIDPSDVQALIASIEFVVERLR